MRLSFIFIYNTFSDISVFMSATVLIFVVIHLHFRQLYSWYIWWFASQSKFTKFITSWQSMLNTDNFQALKAYDIRYLKCCLHFVCALIFYLFLILVVFHLFLINVGAHQPLKYCALYSNINVCYKRLQAFLCLPTSLYLLASLHLPALLHLPASLLPPNSLHLPASLITYCLLVYYCPLYKIWLNSSILKNQILTLTV